jgi:farnesyl diphosphate synthase
VSPDGTRSDSLALALSATASRIEEVMAALLPDGDGPEKRLHDAMRYAALDGGKRLRPFLVMQGAALFDVAPARAERAAAAIEFVHCYSLVHDDLPAMDDDDLRRGKPTCHVAFDEATAILVGDALQALAFELLAHPATHSSAEVRCELVSALASGAGAEGMVGGQMFDLQAEVDGAGYGIDEITRLQAMKTGRLFAFACRAGAILGEADAPARAALDAYARDLGLAFQIADDILDATGDEAEVGKKVGKDAAAGKATFISLLGLEGARARAKALAAEAAEHLDLFGDKADLLKAVARFVVERRA